MSKKYNGVIYEKTTPKIEKMEHSSSKKGRDIAKKTESKMNAPKDNRVGRLKDVKTDRGTFRMKSNRKGED